MQIPIICDVRNRSLLMTRCRLAQALHVNLDDSYSGCPSAWHTIDEIAGTCS